MKANISTETGIKEVEVSASYRYKGVDIFIVFTGFEACSSEWRTGFRIREVEFQDLTDDDEAIKAIVEKTNTAIDRAIEQGKLLPAIEKAIAEHGIINAGEMPSRRGGGGGGAMTYAQIKSGGKLHLAFESDGMVSQPICGQHANGYRMTINVPLAHACKRCQAVFKSNGGAKVRKQFFESLAKKEATR